MLLLDSNVIIWWILGDGRLGNEARQILVSPGVRLSVSLISLFEIELKSRAGKLRLPGQISEFLDKFDIEVYSPIADELSDIMGVDLNHSDPFDCALIGLAKLKGWGVMTSDHRLIKAAVGLVKLTDSRK